MRGGQLKRELEDEGWELGEKVVGAGRRGGIKLTLYGGRRGGGRWEMGRQWGGRWKTVGCEMGDVPPFPPLLYVPHF